MTENSTQKVARELAKLGIEVHDHNELLPTVEGIGSILGAVQGTVIQQVQGMMRPRNEAPAAGPMPGEKGPALIGERDMKPKLQDSTGTRSGGGMQKGIDQMLPVTRNDFAVRQIDPFKLMFQNWLDNSPNNIGRGFPGVPEMKDMKGFGKNEG